MIFTNDLLSYRVFLNRLLMTVNLFKWNSWVSFFIVFQSDKIGKSKGKSLYLTNGQEAMYGRKSDPGEKVIPKPN